jgi:hypothetical protein
VWQKNHLKGTYRLFKKPNPKISVGAGSGVGATCRVWNRSYCQVGRPGRSVERNMVGRKGGGGVVFREERGQSFSLQGRVVFREEKTWIYIGVIFRERERSLNVNAVCIEKNDLNFSRREFTSFLERAWVNVTLSSKFTFFLKCRELTSF